MKNNKLIIFLLLLIACLAFNPTKKTIAVEKKEYKTSAEALALGFKSDALYECILGAYDDSYAKSAMTKEDLANMFALSCHDLKIDDATGIEQLTGLEYLDLSNNNLTNIDLSKNTKLSFVNLADNKLTNIKFPSSSTLFELYLDNNRLTNLDFSNLPGLGYLFISSNNLESLDLSKNTGLVDLYAANNQIKNVKLNSNNLVLLDLDNNNLTSIDLSKLEELGYLNLSYNNLTTIDLSKNPYIKELYISSNKLKSLDLSKQIYLQYINATSNDFDKYSIPNKENIKYMAIDYDKLKDINFREYTDLRLLEINYYKTISVLGDQVKKSELLKQLPEGVEVEDVEVLSNYDEQNVACSCMSTTFNNDDQFVFHLPDQTINLVAAAQTMTAHGNEPKVVSLQNSGDAQMLPAQTPFSGFSYEYMCKETPITTSIIASEDTTKVQVRSINFRVSGVPEEVAVRFNAYYDLQFMRVDEETTNENGDTIITNVPDTAATVLSIVIFGLMIFGIGVCIILQAIQKKEIRND